MVKEHLDYLLSSDVPASQLEQRSADGILRLHEKFPRNMDMKRERVLALEADSRCIAAEIAELQEHGIEISQELRKIFTDRVRRGGE